MAFTMQAAKTKKFTPKTGAGKKPTTDTDVSYAQGRLANIRVGRSKNGGMYLSFGIKCLNGIKEGEFSNYFRMVTPKTRDFVIRDLQTVGFGHELEDLESQCPEEGSILLLTPKNFECSDVMFDIKFAITEYGRTNRNQTEPEIVGVFASKER